MEKKDSLELVFVRHAQRDYENCGDRDPADSDLTEKGEHQCIALGRKLKDIPIDAYLTSSLLRSFKTAVGVCNAKPDKPRLEICPELIECGCTPGYYGCSEEYLRQYYSNARMCDTKLYSGDRYDFACQTTEENLIRAQKLLDYLRGRFTFGQRVAVFTHHGTIEHLIPVAIGIDKERLDLVFDDTSLSVIEYRRDGRTILRCLNR